MTWSLVSFQTALRDSLPDKARMTTSGKVTMFIWRLFTIAARVTALALFASFYHWYVLVFAAAHFAVMLVWMARQNTVYCQLRVNKKDGTTEIHNNEFLEFCFRAMAAFVHIFCFINLLEGHSRLRCLAFYTLVYMENITLILLWYIPGSTTMQFSWYITPALIFVILGFIIGIFFQLAYYKCFHPNLFSPPHKEYVIQTCVPWKDLSMFNGLTLPGEVECVVEEEQEPLSNSTPIYKPNRIIEQLPSRTVTPGGDSLPSHQGSVQNGHSQGRWSRSSSQQMTPLQQQLMQQQIERGSSQQVSPQGQQQVSQSWQKIPSSRPRYAQRYTQSSVSDQKPPPVQRHPAKDIKPKSTEV